MNVLVTDLRYRMSLAAIRDLSEAGHTVYGLHYGSPAEPRPAAAFSRCLAGWRMAEDLDGAARASAARSEADRRDAVILPVGARTVAALSEERDGDFLVPSPAQLRFAGDKSAVLALADKLGLETPAGWDGPGAAQAPAVIKYRDGEALGLHAAQRYTIVTKQEQLAPAYAKMAALAGTGGQQPPLIQQYVPGEGLGVSCLFDRESRPVAVICHRRLREYPVDGGPSAACEAIWDDGLAERALTLLRALSWRGVAMVEFKGTVERPVLMEINPRIWGSFPLTRVAKSGFSEAYVRAAAGEELPEAAGPTYEVGAKMGFRLSNMAAAAAYLKRGRLGECARALRDARRLPDGVLDDRDPKASRVYKRQAVLRRGR